MLACLISDVWLISDLAHLSSILSHVGLASHHCPDVVI